MTGVSSLETLIHIDYCKATQDNEDLTLPKLKPEPRISHTSVLVHTALLGPLELLAANVVADDPLGYRILFWTR